MLFTNATVITVDPQRRIIADGAIRVDGERIGAIGKSSDLRTRYPAEEVVDVHGQRVIPGLIDTHVHLAQAMIRGCADHMELIGWLTKRVRLLQGNYTEADGA